LKASRVSWVMQFVVEFDVCHFDGTEFLQLLFPFSWQLP